MPEVFLFLTEARSPSRFSGSRSSHRSHSGFFPHALLLRIFASCPSCSCQLVAPGVLTQVVCSSFSVSLHPLSLYAETHHTLLGLSSHFPLPFPARLVCISAVGGDLGGAPVRCVCLDISAAASAWETTIPARKYCYTPVKHSNFILLVNMTEIYQNK